MRFFICDFFKRCYTFGIYTDAKESTLDELVRTRHSLHIAAREGNIEIIEILLKQPCIEKNVRDASGDTALSYAAKHDQQTAVEVIVILIFYVCFKKDCFFLETGTVKGGSRSKYSE